MLTGSIASGLLMLEAGARVVAYLAPGGGEGQLRHRGEAFGPAALVGKTKGGILRRSGDPALIYELVPALETTFRDQPVAINMI